MRQYGPSRSPQPHYMEKRDVYSVEYETRWDEDSATILIEIDGVATRAFLDTGAKIKVMDGSTMRKLNLRNRLVHSQGCVFGWCSTP